MAKPFRSPLLGYNHNLPHLGRVFHVQSEDSGPGTPRLFTHLFYEGTILVSRKHEYDPSLADDKVRVLMKAQHKNLIMDLMSARLDERIVAFFAARGEDLARVQGAVPEAPLLETPGPVMVLPGASDPAAGLNVPDVSAAAAAAAGVIGGGQVVDGIVDAEVPPRESGGALPRRIGPKRTATRPIATAFQRGAAPNPVVVRASDAGGPPFVRGGTAPIVTGSSTDGVVVQRNVVVGGAAARPARIRPPVPYVVTGGGHTERPPKSSSSGSVTQPMTPPPSVAGPVPGSASGSAAETPRATGGFGVGRADDKSLDEVILEYLSEDSEPA